MTIDTTSRIHVDQRGVDPVKFRDPDVTVKGQRRARVPFEAYETVWFNTGTLCNIACHNCYIDSSPKNDQLVYLTRAEVARFLDEAAHFSERPSQIGFTGGEPFMNPDMLGMLEDCFAYGFSALVLTNAMRPMQRFKAQLQALNERFPKLLSLRVSLDHFEQQGHDEIRGLRSWERAIEGLTWLSTRGFDISVAARKIYTLDEAEARAGYARLFAELGLDVNASDPAKLVLFPEMVPDDDVVEISEGCWDILGMRPSEVMCSSSRMVLKRKGSAEPIVVACTLIPYSAAFEMGTTLDQARATVTLNHRHCSRFCVLGKASCRSG